MSNTLFFFGPRSSGKTSWAFESAKMVNGVVVISDTKGKLKEYFAERHQFPIEDIFTADNIKNLPTNRPVFVDEITSVLADLLDIQPSNLYGITGGPDEYFGKEN